MVFVLYHCNLEVVLSPWEVRSRKPAGQEEATGDPSQGSVSVPAQLSRVGWPEQGLKYTRAKQALVLGGSEQVSVQTPGSGLRILAGHSGESWACTRHLNAQQEVLRKEGYEGEEDSGERAVGLCWGNTARLGKSKVRARGETCFAGTYQ